MLIKFEFVNLFCYQIGVVSTKIFVQASLTLLMFL